MSLAEKFKHWLARLLVRAKRIKQVQYSAPELNEMVALNLPHQESFTVPGGQASLVVIQAHIDIGVDNAQGLKIKLLCSIDISSVKMQLYRAHLDVTIKAVPYYDKAQSAIRFKAAELVGLEFINDQYLLVRSTNDIIKTLTPNILQGIVNVTVGSALAMLGDRFTPQIKEYLTVFGGANKQRILSFHQSQIAKLVTELVESDQMAYQLEPSDFEEKLFADLGQRIDVEDHQLVFKF